MSITLTFETKNIWLVRSGILISCNIYSFGTCLARRDHITQQRISQAVGKYRWPYIKRQLITCKSPQVKFCNGFIIAKRCYMHGFLSRLFVTERILINLCPCNLLKSHPKFWSLLKNFFSCLRQR